MGFSDFNGGKMLDGSPFPKGTIKMLPALSYCNFLICNSVVIAQKYYRKGMPEAVKAKDKQALEILQKAFPKQKVVQIETTALNFNGAVSIATPAMFPVSVFQATSFTFSSDNFGVNNFIYQAIA